MPSGGTPEQAATLQSTNGQIENEQTMHELRNALQVNLTSR